MTRHDRETALVMLADADRLRAEAAMQPLGPGAARLRLQADHLVASARRLFELVARAEAEDGHGEART